MSPLLAYLNGLINRPEYLRRLKEENAYGHDDN